ACQRGLYPAQDVRHPGEIADDQIAVQAQHRQQLVRNLQMLDGDEQQQRREPGREIGEAAAEHEDAVEVDAAEVRAQTVAPAETIRIGDVGVERGPYEIQADAHRAWARA